MSDDRIEWKYRFTFLEERRREYQSALAHWRTLGCPPSWVIINPEEEIICDRCNGSVDSEQVAVRVLSSGRTDVLCIECVLAWDASRSKRRTEEKESVSS